VHEVPRGEREAAAAGEQREREHAVGGGLDRAHGDAAVRVGDEVDAAAGVVEHGRGGAREPGAAGGPAGQAREQLIVELAGRGGDGRCDHGGEPL
jgi:hypothetical protein